MRQRGLTQASNLYASAVPAKGHDFEAPARVYIPPRNSTQDKIKGLLQTVIEGLARKEVYTPQHNGAANREKKRVHRFLSVSAKPLPTPGVATISKQK
jgi:hypothetical protein